MAPRDRKLCALNRDGSKFNLAINSFSRELNFPYVREIRPPFVDAGMTKAGCDKGAGTKWKACLRAIYGQSEC